MIKCLAKKKKKCSESVLATYHISWFIGLHLPLFFSVSVFFSLFTPCVQPSFPNGTHTAPTWLMDSAQCGTQQMADRCLHPIQCFRRRISNSVLYLSIKRVWKRCWNSKTCNKWQQVTLHTKGFSVTNVSIFISTGNF